MIYAVQFNQDSLLITTSIKAWAITSDSHRFYTKIRELAKDESNWDEVEALLDVSEHIRNFVDSRLTVTDGLIEFEGRSIGERMSEYMFRIMDENITIDPLIKFIVNLRENPSLRAVNELYTFMNANQLPLTPDGHFLAYKFVTDDYKDCHTGKIDNSVGATPSMPRNTVDDNKEQTCSEGLHFCSMEYLKGGWGHRWMVVKINPRDVVSIPVDYNNTKGRCCAYEVISELDKPEKYRNMEDEELNFFDSVVDDTYDTSNNIIAGTGAVDDGGNINWAEIGASDGANDRDSARTQKRSYASKYNPKHVNRSNYKAAYDEAFNDRATYPNTNTSSFMEDDEVIQVGTDHGTEDRATAQRTKKSYASVRNHRLGGVATGEQRDMYINAYEEAFAGK